jgi:glycosyltransferase involved in cell wall biosynthesis
VTPGETLPTGPLVSIVIPAFNAEAFLAECLDSILSQPGVRTEIIVVDDGSTDGTKALVDNYQGRVGYIAAGRKAGPSAARNLGVSESRGELVAFLDADDVMSPGRLKGQVRALLSEPAVDCVAMDYRNFSTEGTAALSHFETCPLLQAYCATNPEGGMIVMPSAVARSILVEENFCATCGLMFRREFFYRLNGFDERLSGGEDFDLLYRAALLGPIGLLNAVGFARRLHANNATSNAALMLAQKARSREKLARLEIDAVMRRRLRRAASEYQLGLAEEYGRQGGPVDALRALLTKPALRMAFSRPAVRALAWSLVGPAMRFVGRGG